MNFYVRVHAHEIILIFRVRILQYAAMHQLLEVPELNFLDFRRISAAAGEYGNK